MANRSKVMIEHRKNKRPLNPASILKAIRDSGGIDAIQLARHFEPLTGNHARRIDGILRNLVEAGLAEAVDKSTGDKLNDSYMWTLTNAHEAFLKPTQHLFRLQSALELSLTSLAKTSSNLDVTISPIFGPPNKSLRTDVFVLMPFLDELRPVYDNHIKKSVEKVGLSCGRADDLFGPREIMKDIWSSIFNARFIVADCTGRNPNVFYEMGIAHSIGKDVILITQNKMDIPFDIGYQRYFKYEYTPPGMTRLEGNMTKALKELLSNNL